MEGVDASTKGAAGPANARGGVVDSDNLPPYNDVDEQQDFQLPVMSNTYKEILDVALRCAAILEDRKWCRRLASASRVMVSSRRLGWLKALVVAEALGSFPAVVEHLKQRGCDGGRCEGSACCW